MIQANIINIAFGKAKEYQIKDEKFKSGYKKDIYLETANINKLGIEEDIQVDKRYHGGEDKAILIASANHNKEFFEKYNKNLDDGAYGENILVDGLDEKTVYVGDIYNIGEVTVQVTQPRQPCWKISIIYDKDIKRFIDSNNYTGWYVRILKEGKITINDNLELIERVSDISIMNMSNYLKNPSLADENIVSQIINSDFIAKRYKENLLSALIN